MFPCRLIEFTLLSGIFYVFLETTQRARVLTIVIKVFIFTIVISDTTRQREHVFAGQPRARATVRGQQNTFRAVQSASENRLHASRNIRMPVGA